MCACKVCGPTQATGGHAPVCAGTTSARKFAQWGTCLTALLPGETVGNTAPIPGQANVTDTLGHLGVPGSRHPYWDCWYGHPRSRRTHMRRLTRVHMRCAYTYMDMHMHICTCEPEHMRSHVYECSAFSRWQRGRLAARAAAQMHGGTFRRRAAASA